MNSTPRRVGRYDAFILYYGLFEAPLDVLTHARGAEARQRVIDGWGKAGLQIDVNCFLLRDSESVMLVDAGIGSAWGPAYGQARSTLSAAGVRPEQVDRVLITHLHGDHVLGLFEGDAAFFPRAEILVPRTDLDYFTDASAREATPADQRGSFDLAANLQRIYGDRVRAIADGPVLDGIDALPLPGHTPGHTGFLLKGETGSLLIWGDAMHVADLQPADPEIGMVFDQNPEVATRTRRAVLEQAAEESWIVAGNHIRGFGRVERAADGFRIVEA
jgi:glyoxylase-like metal-dependent hydrolase (beta-lactamase superfamily II)